MSKFCVPTAAKIRKGVLANRAVQAVIARPLAECPSLCTEAAILDSKPVTMVHRFGYVSTSAEDAENGYTDVPALGPLVEIVPLRPDDRFHPDQILVVVDPRKLPVTHLNTRAASRTHGTPRTPRAAKPAPATPTVAVEANDDNDDLARSLGLMT